MKISIVIPSHNRMYFLNKLIRRLLYVLDQDSEIIIIDDSPKNIIQLQKIYSKYEILKFITVSSEKNQSYKRNLGIKIAENNLLGFLDDDCQISTDWYRYISYYLKKYPDCILMGWAINANPQSFSAIVDDFRTRRFFHKNLIQKGRNINAKYLDTKNFVAPRKLFSRYKIKFDEKLFYAEDVDISNQFNEHKIPIMYCPKMTVFHFGVTSFFRLMQREFKKGRAKYIYCRKWKTSINKTIFQQLKIIKDISKDEILQRYNLFIRICTFLAIIPCHISFRIGYMYESLTKCEYENTANQ